MGPFAVKEEDRAREGRDCAFVGEVPAATDRFALFVLRIVVDRVRGGGNIKLPSTSSFSWTGARTPRRGEWVIAREAEAKMEVRDEDGRRSESAGQVSLLLTLSL